MIKNCRRWAGVIVVLSQGIVGCAANRTKEAAPLQGVVELEEVAVGFELGGRLRELAVKEGDVVQAGALLARIDDTLERGSRGVQAGQVQVAEQQVSAVKAGARSEELRSLQARVDAAKATEALLQKQAARDRSLVEKGAIATAVIDDAEAQLARASAERAALEHNLKLLRQGPRREDILVADAQARAASAALELNDARLVRHELYAPISGSVLDVSYELGEVVSAGAPVFTLADARKPYVDVFVPQAKISALAVGQAAHVRVDALNGELGGRVEHIARRTEFTPRYLFSENERSSLVVRVRVRIDDPREQLRAGVPAFVRLAGTR
jgi:HlyD family secretion protein